MPYIENRLITLNSNYGSQQNSTMLSNIVFNFTGILKKEDNIKHCYITVLNAQIPVSFYIITSLNNVLSVKDVTSNITYAMTITPGNYTGNTLITEMIYRFQVVSYPYVPTITLNKSTGILTFTFAQNATIIVASSTIKDVLGLGNSNLTNTAIVCPYPLNLLGTKLINITSSALSVNSFSSVNNSNTNILATIPVDQPFFNMISYTNQNDIQKFELMTDYINAIDIQILDEAGNFIDFNFTDWTITLGLSIERAETQRSNVDLYKSLMSHNLQPDENIISDDQTNTINEINEIKESEALDTFNNPPTNNEPVESLEHNATGYTTKVKHIIKEFGNQEIESITLKRTPISDAIYKALNVVSLGKFDSANPYDRLFHLAMDIKFKNGRRVRLEKNATINMTTRPVDKKDTESLEVVGVPSINFNTLLENTKNRMGDKYFPYNAKSNNCQDYILNVFDASRIGDIPDREFIKQSTRDIFNKSPKYLKGMAKVVTDLGGQFDYAKSEIDRHREELGFLLK